MAYRTKLDDYLRRRRIPSTVTPTQMGGRIAVDGPFGKATATGREIEQARRRPGPPETGGFDLTTPYGKSMYRVGIQRGAKQAVERQTAQQQLDDYLKKGRGEFPDAQYEGPVGVPTTGEFTSGAVSAPMKLDDTPREKLRAWIDKMPFEEQQERWGKATPQATKEFQTREKKRRMKGFQDWAKRHAINLDDATPQQRVEYLKLYVKQSNSEDRSADNLLDNQMLKYDVDQGVAQEKADRETKERIQEGEEQFKGGQKALDRTAAAEKAEADRIAAKEKSTAEIAGRKEVAEILTSGKADAAKLKLLEAQQRVATGAFRRDIFKHRIDILDKRIGEITVMLELKPGGEKGEQIGPIGRKWGEWVGNRRQLEAELKDLKGQRERAFEEARLELKPQPTTQPTAQLTTQPAVASSLPVVKTEAELKQYPSGTRVIGPSGFEMIVP